MSAREFKEEIARTKDEIDAERHFLGTTVRLSDGSEGLVFSRGPKNESDFFLYNCHLCAVPNLPGERCLQTHITGRKHQSKLQQPVIDAETFRASLVQRTKIQMNIAPGEPVPPGFENEVKPLPEIKPFIDNFKEGALIGIEYAVELVSKEDREASYLCILCAKRGDPRTIFAHWTSFNHRLKYLEKHFPSVIKELVPYRYNPEARNVMPRIVQMITEAIEDHHGRLSPTVCENSDFKRNRNKVLQEMIADRHFDEKSGPNFLYVIDRRIIDDLIKNSKGSIAINIDSQKRRDPSPPQVKAPKRIKSESLLNARKARDSLDSISSDSDTEFSSVVSRSRNSKTPTDERDIKRKRKAESSNARINPRVQRSPPFDEYRAPKEKKPTLPTPKELSKQASEISQERYKWEKYRCLLEIAIKDLEKILQEHEKNPEKHPLYPDEWKKFWNRRYKELQAEKKDPNKHDFKPEWIVFWTKRMKELHDEEVAMKKIEIKKKLGLPEDGEEKTDQLKQQYKIKTPLKTEKLTVIDISDDESLSSHPKPKKVVRSKSRSLSPFSDDEVEKKSKKYYMGNSREARDRYAQEYYRHSSRDYARGFYGSSAPHFGYRTLDPYNYPQYEPPKKEEEEEDEGPLTVVAVLRLLTALEDHLGSLGPKVVDLLAKALALEKVKANSADEMLLNDDNCVFFETAKEKLKGQLIADVLDSHKIKAVKKAIRNIAALIHQVNESATEKARAVEKNEEESKEAKKPQIGGTQLPFDRQLIASKLAAALVMQERTDISTENMDRLIHAFILMVKVSKDKAETVFVKDILLELGIVTEEEYVEDEIDDELLKKDLVESMFETNDEPEEPAPQTAPSSSLESLTDSDLQTLLQNFKHLSSDEQHHLIAHLKKLESTDPGRVEKLRKFVDIQNLKEDTELEIPTSKIPTKDYSYGKRSESRHSGGNKEESSHTSHKLVDSDDDDYNFEEVVKIASNNVKGAKYEEEINRADFSTRDRDEEISNMSRGSSASGANLNSMSDTQNLIANLMGTLQKNNASFINPSNPNTIEATSNIKKIPSMITSASSNDSNNVNNPNSVSNLSNFNNPNFAMQFFQQASQQLNASQSFPSQQQSVPSQQQSRNVNFGMGNMSNLNFNSQLQGSNFNNCNPFTNFSAHQKPSPNFQQTQQILQDFIMQQQQPNFRSQNYPPGTNF